MRNIYWRRGILFRSAMVLLASFILVGAVTVTITIRSTSDRAHRAANERLGQMLDTVENTLSVACFAVDAKLADEVAQGLLKNKEVQSNLIEAINPDGSRRTLAEAWRAPARNGFTLTRTLNSPFDPDTAIGHIRLEANMAVIEAGIREEVRFVILQIIGQLVPVGIALAAVMMFFILRPIKAMSDGLHNMDATRGERLATPKSHVGSEIGRLVEDINTLAGNLADALAKEHDLRLEKEIGERKYHSIFENAETGIFIAGSEGTVHSWNPAFARLTGIPRNEAFEGTLKLRQLPWENPSRVVELAMDAHHDNTPLADDLAIQFRNGIRRWFHLVLTPVGEDQIQGVMHDVSEHKEAEASARRLAITDLLTGVSNRAGLEEKLRDLLDDPLVAQTGGFTLMLLDIDNFKRINEGYGLPIGDAILKGVANRIGNDIKESDVLARLGGDRFALILQSVPDRDAISHIAQRLLREIRPAFYVEGAPVEIHACLGIVDYPADGNDIPQLLRNAELALDRAKMSGGDTLAFFDAGLAEAADQRMALESDLRHAIRNGQFVLYLQPIIDLAANRLTGAEALIRWHHPDKGLIPPDAFIPLAEETGLIDDIGLWAMEAACKQLSQWRDEGADRYLSINVSGHQIPGGLTPSTLEQTVRRHGIDPALLALEITEGILMADLDKALGWIDACRARGFRIYLDDFGTGYSSLSYLKRLPIDILKIDKSFVRDMGVDGSDLALIEAVIAMARTLGIGVVAEGVENAEQLRLLRAMSCGYAQGYFFSRPLPADRFEAEALRIDALLAERAG